MDKFEKVMKEFFEGQLTDSEGNNVTEKDQALAIAYSESGLSRKENRGFKTREYKVKEAEKYNEYYGTHTMPFHNKPQKTEEGFLIVDTVISEMGVLPYQYTNSKGEVFTQHEFLDSSIFSKDYLDSCEGAPFVLDHPQDITGEFVNVTPNNYNSLVKGVLTNPRIDRKSNKVLGTLKVWDPETIDKIESEEMKEVSGGYRCRVVPESGNFDGQQFNARQTNMIMNHLALVDKGRAGEGVRVLYNSKNAQILENFKNGRKQMSKIKDGKVNTGTPLPSEEMPGSPQDNPVEPVVNESMQIMQMLSEILKMLKGAPAEVENKEPEKPTVEGAGPAPSKAEVEKEVLNKLAANSMPIILKSINEAETTLAQAHAVLGGDVKNVFARFNTLHDFKKHLLIDHGDFDKSEVDKMNAIEVDVNYKVFTKHAQQRINAPKHNSLPTNGERQISIKDL